MKNHEILIKRVRKDAKIPYIMTSGSAGFDICAAINSDFVLKKGTTCKLPSGIALGIMDENLVALLMPRSGLSINHGITLANTIGVIDSDYRGEIIVALKNLGDLDYTVKPGERIAQILFFSLPDVNFTLTDDDLPATKRGESGFGSTGKV